MADPEFSPEQLAAALEFEVAAGEGKTVPLREFFVLILGQLWEEADEFSGKRPFGNSGWYFEIIWGLIDDGVAESETEAHNLVAAAIRSLAAHH